MAWFFPSPHERSIRVETCLGHSKVREAMGHRSRTAPIGTGPRFPGIGPASGILIVLAALPLASCMPDREARLQEILRRSRAAPERIVQLERGFLSDEDPDVRALAVWAIGDCHAPDGPSALAPLAGDRSPTVRLAVAKALCASTDPAATEAVAALTSDRDTSTRREAVRCLAFSSAPSPDVLMRALRDSDRAVRAAALGAFTRHPWPGALSELETVFGSDDPDEQVAAIGAIRALNDPAALEALEKAAASRLAPRVRDAVEATILALRETAKAATSKEEIPEPRTGAAGPASAEGERASRSEGPAEGAEPASRSADPIAPQGSPGIVGPSGRVDVTELPARGKSESSKTAERPLAKGRRTAGPQRPAARADAKRSGTVSRKPVSSKGAKRRTGAQPPGSSRSQGPRVPGSGPPGDVKGPDPPRGETPVPTAVKPVDPKGTDTPRAAASKARGAGTLQGSRTSAPKRLQNAKAKPRPAARRKSQAVRVHEKKPGVDAPAERARQGANEAEPAPKPPAPKK